MNWLQLVYQYSIGGVFFGVSLWLCFQLGAARMRNPSDRRALWICLIGFVGYLLFHTTWIVLAS